MKAMILAAGRGERLRPITDTIPKPLVKVGGIPLIEWHIQKLKKAGITNIIVNSAYLSQKIVDFLGDGKKFGVNITHSVEGLSGLETAGGITKALPFFEGEDFLVVNGDTFIDADYEQFLEKIDDNYLAKLYLVDNPKHNLKGDFSLLDNGNVIRGDGYTFSGVAMYKTSIFENLKIEKMPLLPIFIKLEQQQKLTGKLLNGKWFDVGTIERLNQVETYLKDKI